MVSGLKKVGVMVIGDREVSAVVSGILLSTSFVFVFLSQGFRLSASTTACTVRDHYCTDKPCGFNGRSCRPGSLLQLIPDNDQPLYRMIRRLGIFGSDVQLSTFDLCWTFLAMSSERDEED